MTLFTPRKATNWIVVHCAATPPTLDVGVKEIRVWHKQRGFVDIGYHFVIRRDGTIEVGRPENVIGAHVEGYNSDSVAVSLVGGVNAKNQPENNFTPAQFAALALKLRELQAKYPNAKIQGHRDFPKVAKACPSFDVRKWIAETGVFVTSHADPEPEARSIEIKAGDTLYSIAERYAHTVAEIVAVNPHVDPAKLQIGSVLRLPG
jgi:N-acetyl-anhydromuramyl-L-alanine amidase AmpD